MHEWKVYYRDQLDQDRTTGSIVSKEAALVRAKDLRRQRAEVYKIEGPDGLTLPQVEIRRWMSDNRY